MSAGGPYPQSSRCRVGYTVDTRARSRISCNMAAPERRELVRTAPARDRNNAVRHRVRRYNALASVSGIE